MVEKIVIFLYKNLITNPGNSYPLKNPQFDSILPPQPNIFIVFPIFWILFLSVLSVVNDVIIL